MDQLKKITSDGNLENADKTLSLANGLRRSMETTLLLAGDRAAKLNDRIRKAQIEATNLKKPSVVGTGLKISLDNYAVVGYNRRYIESPFYFRWLCLLTAQDVGPQTQGAVPQPLRLGAD